MKTLASGCVCYLGNGKGEAAENMTFLQLLKFM